MSLTNQIRDMWCRFQGPPPPPPAPEFTGSSKPDFSVLWCAQDLVGVAITPRGHRDHEVRSTSGGAPSAGPGKRVNFGLKVRIRLRARQRRSRSGGPGKTENERSDGLEVNPNGVSDHPVLA